MRIIVMNSTVVHRIARSTPSLTKEGCRPEREDADGSVRGRRANASMVPRTGQRLPNHCQVGTANGFGQLVWDWM